MGLEPAAFAQLDEAIARERFPKTTAVLVVYRGRLIYERYFGVGGRDYLNDTRSATKSVTALAVGAAIDDGAISAVNAPALKYLADLGPFGNDSALKQSMTIEDLLTMSSPLDCNDDVETSPGNEDRMHEQQRWARWAVDLPTKPDYVRDAQGRGPFSYCTAGAFLLGQIVQRATHVKIDEYVEQRLLLPLGITRWSWPQSPSGEVMTGGGLQLRARDLAKLAWMLALRGRWHGRAIISAAWVDAALHPYRMANPEQEYGYLFWQRNYTTPCGIISGWYMAGNGGNAIVVLTELNAAVVVTRRAYNTHGMHAQTVDLLEHYVLPALACRDFGEANRPDRAAPY